MSKWVGSGSDWIGVDFDGTLAKYETWEPGKGMQGGEPIPKIFQLVKGLIDNGKTVKIFTARVSFPGESAEQTRVVHAWLEKWGLPKLEVTCVKDFMCMYMIDDRAIACEKNTGELFGPHVEDIYKDAGLVRE